MMSYVELLSAWQWHKISLEEIRRFYTAYLEGLVTDTHSVSSLGYVESLWYPVPFILQPHNTVSMTVFIFFVNCWVR